MVDDTARLRIEDQGLRRHPEIVEAFQIDTSSELEAIVTFLRPVDETAVAEERVYCVVRRIALDYTACVSLALKLLKARTNHNKGSDGDRFIDVALAVLDLCRDWEP